MHTYLTQPLETNDTFEDHPRGKAKGEERLAESGRQICSPIVGGAWYDASNSGASRASSLASTR